MSTTAGARDRSEIPESDKWDLKKLFADHSEWEKGLAELETQISRIEQFKGTLKESVASLHRCVSFRYIHCTHSYVNQQPIPTRRRLRSCRWRRSR